MAGTDGIDVILLHGGQILAEFSSDTCLPVTELNS